MKVMCIKDGFNVLNTATGEVYLEKDAPKKDHPYTVIDESSYKGIVLYELSEFPPHDGNRKRYWEKRCFVPLDKYLDKFTESLNEELDMIKEEQLITTI